MSPAHYSKLGKPRTEISEPPIYKTLIPCRPKFHPN